MESSQATRNRRILVVAVGAFIALNAITLFLAYPETMRIDSGCCGDRALQKDFSAFYTGAWRLLNDPSNVYTSGNVADGGAQTIPPPEQYKYTPSFLLVIVPFLLLGYQQALTAFDLFQFLLLPLVALLIFALTRRRGLAVTLVVEALVLVLPLPWPHWGLSVPYYWQWAEGQSKVLETFLLLLSFYLGMGKRPVLSGLTFALAVFDLRFALIALPLFVFYNKGALGRAISGAVGTFLVTNSPLLLYPGMGSGFIAMMTSSGIDTPLYYYTWIPLSAVVALTVLEAYGIARTFRDIGRRVKV